MQTRRQRKIQGKQAAKLSLLERFSPQMLATARRYSANLHDAEDAYQRAAEILLTREPTGTDDDLCRWLRTTVKHEALAIRGQRERVLPLGGPEWVPEPSGAQPPDTHERAERFERLRVGAQALGRLKPQEVRCLLLKAEGYTYGEICSKTGWSYTKVNRCLTEGRRAFVERVAGIESGAECERLRPLLSALADGEAGPDDLAALRPHLRTCLPCRALLREYREAPSRVAALVPPAALAAAGGGGDGGPVRALLESMVGAAQDRAAALGERAHQATEMAAGQKAAAVAASAAALAGGGVGVEKLSERAGDGLAPAAEVAPGSTEAVKEADPAVAPPPSPTAAPTPAPPAAPARAAAPAPEPSPSNEFAPEATAAPTPTRPAAAAASGEFSPGGGGGGAGGGEFAP